MDTKTIQKNALQQYKTNLEYLKNNDNELFSRIISLSNYIDTQEYKERYHLEYIREDQHFDIFDTHTKTYLYGREPKKFIKEAVGQTKFNKENTFDLLLDPIYNHFNDLQPHNNNNLENKSVFEMIQDIKEYTSVFNTSTADLKKEFKYLDKFIFVGTLLGTHFLPIHNKIKANVYFICDNNLEIFRLSLFTTDYKKLGDNAQIIFTIMDEENTFKEKFQLFFKNTIRSNYMLKYYCSNYNIGNLFDKLLSHASSNSPIMYKYTKILDGLLKLNMENIPNYPVLNTKVEHTILANKPVLLIGAGPSLQKNIQWIHKNKNNYTLLSVGAAVVTLLKYDIEPNIIISVDPDEEIKFQFPDEIMAQLSNTILLTATATHSDVLKKFNSENIILYEMMACYKQNSANISGFSVGEVALHLAIMLGASDVYMVGTDLAFDQETGATHSSDHLLNETYNITNKSDVNNHIINENRYSMHTSNITVKGNFRERVITDLRFHKSIIAYEQILKSLFLKNDTIKIFNLSDGAYIPYTVPFEIDSIPLSKSQELILSTNTIYEYLKNNSEIGFSAQDTYFLLNSIEVVAKFVKVLKNINTLKCKSYEQFIEQREPIFKLVTTDLNKFNNFYLSKMYFNYILLTEPYFGYQCNDKNQIKSSTIKKVKKIWIKQMIRISHEYIALISAAI